MSDRFGIGKLINGYVILLCLLPLGIWKLIDIIVWCVKNIRISIN